MSVAEQDDGDEVVRLVEQLEKCVLSTNLRGVRSAIKELEGKFAHKPSLASVVDSGAVQALLGALNQSRRDLQVTEAVLSSILALGHRPLLLQVPISVSLLLRTEGLLGVCRAANEHRNNVKTQAMVLRIFANCCRDEQGCRMVVFGPGVSFLLEAISRGRQEVLGKELVSLALSALAQCAVFHWEARKLASKASVLLDMIDLCRRYAGEADVLEPAMCLFCMMSTGVEVLLTRQEDLDDIGSIALNMLNVFALRTFDEVAAASSVAATGANVTPSKFQSLTARFTSPLSTPTSSASPPFPMVTSSTERRCSSWCLLLLGNLAKFNKQVRNQIIQTIVQTGVQETELRYQQILEKLLASCLDDVVAADAAEDGKDFVNLAAAATTAEQQGPLALLLSQSEDALMAQVLFCVDPNQLFQDAQFALLLELGKTKVAPVSELGSKLLTLMFAMLQHPIVRAKLSAQVLDSAIGELLPAIKAKSGENGEYFTLFTKQLEHKLESQFPMYIPFRAFPLLVDTTTERKSVLDLEAVDFSFAGWRHNPKELCHQITLKMEALFASVDNTTCHLHREQNQKFLAFHTNLQYTIKLELLLQGEDSVRASMLECIVDVASYSATGIVGNLDLTLICLTLLQSNEVARLGLTWKRVREPYKRVLNELLTLATFQDLHELDRTMLPPPLLQSPRIPYLKGFLSAMDKPLPDTNNHNEEDSSYACFNAWFPNLSKSGDWYGRNLQIAPLPGVQIALGRIASTAVRSTEEEGEEETDLTQLSNKLEPDWLIDQGEAHDALVLQSHMEQLVEGLDSIKLVQKRQLSIESSGKLVLVLVEELVGKKKLARPTPVAAKICLERIILGPISSRLFLQAVQSCELEEREFQTQLSKIKLLGSEEAWLRQLDIPAKFAQVPWRGAIAVLNQWICSPIVSPPSSSLGVLLRFKDELFLEAKTNKLKHLTAEDLIPIVVLILVRSQVLNYYLCSHLYFIKTFLGDDELSKQGEALYYLITLESAVYQVRKHSL
ncbi:hypothetical protein BASA81_012343 [Batrachochytrium salamandrivorans]|nr:hypothetical protein BASA81_012343 [Batrachochytrium salamandrivorans]